MAVWLEEPGVGVSGTPADIADEPRATSVPRERPEVWSEATVNMGTIAGSFRVIRKLGSGGMGVVLLAEDTTLDRRVALKLIRPELTGPDFFERFVTEARAMARVNHPNVAQVHTFGIHEGAPYLVMQFVEGKTLDQWLVEQDGPPDVDLALHILKGLCAGVSAIHAKDTVHCDLKPANVILDESLGPHIVDLGLAVLGSSAVSNNGQVIGTPGYMAPEILFPAEEAGPLARTDVYAIACIAYAMLTGEAPFSSETESGMLLQHASQPLRLPSVVRPELGTAFDDALVRGLAKLPSKRTPTPEALFLALAAARAGSLEPVHILLAEDDEDFRELVRDSLLKAFPGAEVECVGDGETALAAFRARTPSIALLDLHMPGIDGTDLTRIFRDHTAALVMPILVFTGGGGADDWKRLSALGADGFLVKPLATSDMIALVRRTLHERKSMSFTLRPTVPPPPPSEA